MSDQTRPGRRQFIGNASLGLAGIGAGLGAGRIGAAGTDLSTGAAVAAAPWIEAPEPPQSGITTLTIAESEKIHGLEFTGAERDRLLPTIPGQLAAVKAIRAIPKPLELQPALCFDPQIPGVEYPPQPDRVRLANHAAGPLPAADIDIAYASVRDQAEWIRSGQLTSRRLTEIYLERIHRLAPALLCYITVTAEVARAQAEQVDRDLAAGRHRGPLHGIPYAIKDLFDTAGIATTWGALPYRDRVPSSDAAIVTKLREAGAVLLGKLATGTLANGAEWFGGTCRNPWNPDEPAGGSSTGSGSATAAALCSFSIGTDSLGSILNPADRCGTVGLRATFGRVPTAGAMPLTPSLDRIGPLTRRVEDAAIVLAAIHGSDPTSATSIAMGFEYDASIPLDRLRVGYSKSWFERFGFTPAASVPVSAAHHAALAALGQLGISLVEVELPRYPYQALFNTLYVEAAAVFEELTLDGRDDQLPDRNGIGWPDAWRRVHLLSAVDYLQAERVRRLIMNDFHRIFERVDALVAPTYGSFELLAAMNYTGHPGLGLRVGFTESPTRDIGPTAAPGPATRPRIITQNLTLHGRLYQEGTLLAIGHALERRLAVWDRRPPIG
jgi:Asp-tRNA(Asn)/Glu-tRNA(Gln) amidotransferase A subunit family amidase